MLGIIVVEHIDINKKVYDLLKKANPKQRKERRSHRTIIIYGAVVVLVVGYFILNSVAQDADISGKITSPTTDTLITATPVPVSGVTKNIPKGMYVWIVKEIGNLVWPKKSPLKPNAPFDVVIYESDRNYTLGLYAVDKETHEKIKTWFRQNHKTGIYPGITWISKKFRLDSVTPTF